MIHKPEVINPPGSLFKLNKAHLPTLSLIGVFIAIVFIYLTTCGSTESIAQKGKAVVKDTIPTYIIRVPVIELQKSMDSLNIVVSYVGRSLSVDQSEDVKRLYARMMNTILRNVSLDSTTVPKSKK